MAGVRIWRGPRPGQASGSARVAPGLQLDVTRGGAPLERKQVPARPSGQDAGGGGPDLPASPVCWDRSGAAATNIFLNFTFMEV